MKRLPVLLTLFAAAAAGAAYELWPAAMQRLPKAEIVRPGSATQPLTLLSQGYRIDRLYKSMEGPSAPHPGLKLPCAENDRFTWLTGVESEVVDAASSQTISSEFMCHANLTFDQSKQTPEQYNQSFGGRTHLEWRLFSMIPGRFSIRLPEGFGIPVPKDAVLDYYTMVLNQNVRDRVLDVRVKTKVHAIPASDKAAPTKALFRRALYTLQPLSSGASDPAASTMTVPVPVPAHVGAGCAAMCSVNSSAVASVGNVGEGQTTHWLIPPGKHTYVTKVSPQMNLPFDTTIHYATCHLHHYGRSMKLRDLSTGETIIDLKSKDLTDRLGVAQVDEVKSIQGIPVRASGEYELVVEYDNTSDHNIDAMGMLYLYMLEKDFSPEAERPLTPRATAAQ